MLATLLHADMRAGWSWRGAVLQNCTDQHKTWIMKRRWRERDLGKQEAARSVHEEIGADTNKHGTAMWGNEADAVRCRWEREQLLGEHWCCQSSGDADELRLMLSRDRQGREDSHWWSQMHWGGNESSTRSWSTAWAMGDAVLVTAAAVMGEKHGKHSAHGGDTDCLISPSVSTQQNYCRNTNSSKQTSYVFIRIKYTHIHTHIKWESLQKTTWCKWLICISACAQEDSDLHQSSKVRRDAPGWHYLHRQKQTNKPDLLSLQETILNSACMHQISFPAFPVSGTDR